MQIQQNTVRCGRSLNPLGGHTAGIHTFALDICIHGKLQREFLHQHPKSFDTGYRLRPLANILPDLDDLLKFAIRH